MLGGTAHAETGALGIDAYRVDWKVWAAWFVGFAVLSAVFPRDAHFDVSHYHLQNGWSLLEGRLLQDMAPAGLHSFLNPIHSAFIWFLVDNLPGPLVVALLSPIHAAILPVTYAFGARAGGAQRHSAETAGRTLRGYGLFRIAKRFAGRQLG